MNILPVILNRKSLRAFADQPVDDQTFYALFEAARWAPSAFNEQPWRFIVARKGEAGFDRMSDCLAPSNRTWAKQAAFLILVLCKKELTRNGAANRHASHDTGLAIGNLSVQATASGLVLHQMGGFDVARSMTDFGIPDGYEVLTIIAGGFPGDPDMLDEELRKRELAPRSRKTLDELVFSEGFGHPHPFFMSPPSRN